jgi:hypothetical protein
MLSLQPAAATERGKASDLRDDAFQQSRLAALDAKRLMADR